MSDWNSPGWFGLALLGVVAAATTLTGRLHVALAGPRRLMALGPFEAQVSAVLGTVWWMVLLTAGSAAGLDAPSSVVGCLLLHGVALAFVVIRRRQEALRPVRDPRAWLTLLVPMVLAGLVGLLPVLRNGRFSTENDSLLYCSLAQWYQDHSFGGSKVFRADAPLAHYAAIYQGAGYPVAPAFLLAGVQALTRAASPVVIYPTVGAWGLTLAIGSLLGFGRRALHWPLVWLLPGGVGLAILLQPLAWAHHMGFLAQTFATPLLLTSMLHLSQVLSPRRWRPSEAVVAGLLAAGVASTYPPFLPLLGGAWTWWLVDRCRHRSPDAWRLTRWVALAVTMAAALVAAQGVDLPGAFGFLRGTLVGSHVDLSAWGFVQATVGAWFWTPFRLEPFVERLRASHLWLVPLYLWLTLRGIRVLARESGSGPLLGGLTVLAVAFVWYGLFTRDPWTAERGHSWNLFKLSQWSFAPVVLALVHGLVSLRRHPWGRWLGPALFLVPVTMAPVYWSFGGWLGAELETFVGSSRPLETWIHVRSRFLMSSAGRLLAADTPASTTPFLPTYLGLLTYPSRLAGDWEGALWIPPSAANEADRLWRLLAQGEPLAVGEPIAAVVTRLRGLVTDDVLRLGGGFGLVKEPTAAHVLAILQPSDDQPGPGGCVWLGRARTSVVAFSPREMRATLRLTASPGRRVADRAQRVVVASQGESREVWLREYPRVDLPVLLRRGAGRVEISFPEEVAGEQDRRRLCVLSMTIRADDSGPR
jgi:hypothetical protein